MSIREFLERNKHLNAGVATALIAIAAVTIFRESRGNRGLPPGISTRAYYTTEDQLTLRLDSRQW